jgi:hypothetical protein
MSKRTKQLFSLLIVSERSFAFGHEMAEFNGVTTMPDTGSEISTVSWPSLRNALEFIWTWLVMGILTWRTKAKIRPTIVGLVSVRMVNKLPRLRFHDETVKGDALPVDHCSNISTLVSGPLATFKKHLVSWINFNHVVCLPQVVG